MKPCSKCRLVKSIDDFHKNKTNADGLQSQCKNCRHIKRVEKWDTNPRQEVTRLRDGKVQTFTRVKNHGESRTPIYRRWLKIKERCYNKNAGNYRFYGALGVTVCDEWLNDFFTFKEWALNNGFSPEKQLDRINPDGPYSPENCRWLGTKENIIRAKTLVSTDTASKLQEDSLRLGISTEQLIATILEEHYK